MKLLRFRDRGQVRPGLLDTEGRIRALDGHVADITGAILADGELSRLAALDEKSLPLVEGNPELAPCVGDIGKFMCIGLNFSDHAEEMGLEFPKHPILFLKANSAINGPSDAIVLPRGSTHTDWEVELGVVIGKAAKYVTEADALDHVAGYCLVNDVSERDFQNNRTGQWTKGKSCDTFGPVGPWLVTRDEIPDPQNLEMRLDVNGVRMQSGNTSRMIFSVAQIIAHLSEMMTLHPGDIIATGTPPGVGAGMKPSPVFLKPGDTMELEIAGLGMQKSKVVMDN